jgi:hypothetical protein
MKKARFTETQIGQYFGNISCSAVTKIGSRMKERIEKDQRVREEIRKVEGKLSLVKGLPFALPLFLAHANEVNNETALHLQYKVTA